MKEKKLGGRGRGGDRMAKFWPLIINHNQNIMELTWTPFFCSLCPEGLCYRPQRYQKPVLCVHNSIRNFTQLLRDGINLSTATPSPAICPTTVCPTTACHDNATTITEAICPSTVCPNVTSMAPNCPSFAAAATPNCPLLYNLSIVCCLLILLLFLAQVYFIYYLFFILP